MIPTYAILLYLSQIFCGNSYSQAQIDVIIEQNQEQINMIQQDPVLMNSINAQYDSMANVIWTTNQELRP